MNKSTTSNMFLLLITNAILWIVAIACCAYVLDGDTHMGAILLILAVNAGASLMILFTFAATTLQKANKTTDDHAA
jgi:peptidoglycan/LPS O-acetylase OafA/YrhL